jgi:hypothetical protein
MVKGNIITMKHISEILVKTSLLIVITVIAIALKVKIKLNISKKPFSKRALFFE